MCVFTDFLFIFLFCYHININDYNLIKQYGTICYIILLLIQLFWVIPYCWFLGSKNFHFNTSVIFCRPYANALICFTTEKQIQTETTLTCLMTWGSSSSNLQNMYHLRGCLQLPGLHIITCCVSIGRYLHGNHWKPSYQQKNMDSTQIQHR